MKKLIAFLAVMAFAPSLFAGEDTEVTHSADFRVRYQHDINANGNEKTNPKETSTWNHRLKWGATFRASETFMAHATLIHGAYWGHSGSTAGTSYSGDSATGQFDGTKNSENVLTVNEAYGAWTVSDNFGLKFGRGSYTMGDGTVISENDWEDFPTAFEGSMGTYDFESVRLGFWGVKFADFCDSAGGTGCNTSEEDDPNVVSWGLNVDVKSLPDFLNMVNVHLITVNTDDAGAIPQSNDMRYGVSLKGDAAGIDYHVVYNVHSGEFTDAKIDKSGSMMQATIGYGLGMWDSRIWFTYHSDTGDDSGTATENETYDSFFYQRHANAGLMDIVAWGNLTSMSLGWDFTPMDDLMVGLQYHIFSRTDDTTTVAVGNNGKSLIPTGTTRGATASAASTGVDDTDIGTEIDIYATHKYEGGFAMTARLGIFTPGKFIKEAFGPAVSDDAYNQFMLEGTMTF